ncbi:MAG: hypothetical protein LBP85_03945 [Prevotellaceae bacterium]|jgi:hypothetical protein|nr:hypothetical protein [Prevotellaceae bacterium]
MADYPAFLIAENKMVDLDGVYILHTRKPRFLAKVRENGRFEIVDMIDSFNEHYKGNADRIEKLMKRLAEWHRAYKIYEYEKTRNRRIYPKN